MNTTKLILTGFFSYCISITLYAQPLMPYKIYTSNGKEIKYEKMLKKIGKSQVLLFGELHNNPICHWLQLEITKSLNVDHQLIMGAEMFESEDQERIDQFLKDSLITEMSDSLISLWPNYHTDYAPLLLYAKENKLPFIATNIPRRYASIVYKKGFEGLDQIADSEKIWMAPLPIEYDAELPSYKEMQTMGNEHGGENLPKAQAIKDATMAYFIAQNLAPNSIFIHLNGTYHSDNDEGIGWYLKNSNKEIQICTISSVQQADIHVIEKENIGNADFIICIDEDMTVTY